MWIISASSRSWEVVWSRAESLRHGFLEENLTDPSKKATRAKVGVYSCPIEYQPDRDERHRSATQCEGDAGFYEGRGRASWRHISRSCTIQVCGFVVAGSDCWRARYALPQPLWYLGHSEFSASSSSEDYAESLGATPLARLEHRMPDEMGVLTLSKPLRWWRSESQCSDKRMSRREQLPLSFEELTQNHWTILSALWMMESMLSRLSQEILIGAGAGSHRDAIG